jgi:biotin-[acetyl-CoA-carboxylase] ligase BirA-like protein
MPILTDTPDATRSLLPEGGAWSAAPDGRLPTVARELWGAFGSGAAPWIARGPLDAAGSERWLLVLDDAPRSQFDGLVERLAAGDDLPDGLACVALAGSRFRGQRGRPWAALRGNLHLSVVLALDLDAAAHQVGLTLLPAVATARAIEAVSEGRLRPGLKWVNDLLLGDRKVAGVLASTQLQGGRVRHAVFGIGVNVARAPDLAPAPRVAAPGCLAPLDPAFAGAAAWAPLLLALLREIERARRTLVDGDGAALFAAYRDRAAFLGRSVTIWPVDEVPGADPIPLARGRVLELLPDLALRLEGRAEPVRVGRMTIDP